MSIAPIHTSPYASTGDGTIHTCPISPTPTVGRLLTAICSTTAPSPVVTSGWTQVSGSKVVGSNELAQYWRWSDGTETSFAADVTASGAGPAVIEVTEWSGLTVGGSDVAANSYVASGSSLTVGPTAALAASGELVLAAFAYAFILPNATPIFTVPPGYTLIGHRRTTNAVGVVVDVCICWTLASSSAAQSATGTYNNVESGIGASIVAYLQAATLAPGQIYPLAKQSWLTQSPSIDADTDTIKCAIGRVSDGYAFVAAHQYFSDVQSVMATNYAASVTVPGLAAPLGILASGSPHIQFNVTTGAALDFLIVFDDKGSAATSPLVAYVPLASQVLPTAGRVVQVDWDPTGILRI